MSAAKSPIDKRRAVAGRRPYRVVWVAFLRFVPVPRAQGPRRQLYFLKSVGARVYGDAAGALLH